ncbi:hypothetical protein [Herbaspirillum autotrophicum]|uniref:hypothetical protein n=1 Tax=Herbaspirillum autotrophicum TaxID=180195 RepID=UPI00067C4862|nr:hypothetical protein [Herbaspirillum autotrophicum]
MGIDLFDFLKWVSGPIVAIVVVWLGNYHSRRKDKAAREYALRKEVFEPILLETVRAMQQLAEMIGGYISPEIRMEQARLFGAAVARIQLIGSPETVRLVQRYALSMNTALFDSSMAAIEISTLKTRADEAPVGPLRIQCDKDHAIAMTEALERLSPVIERLISESIPVILALRKELDVDTDDEEFELVTRQTADDGKRFFLHISQEMRIRMGLTTRPPTVEKYHQ